MCERQLETEQNCNILTPTLTTISVVSFSLSWCSTGGPGAQLSAGFLYHILSPNSSDLQLTDFLSSPTYIIVQSPTQYLPMTGHRDVSFPPSLEWHVWSSSSGNNCHAVQRSLSSGASVYEYTMGFYLVLFCQPSPPTRFLLTTAIGMCYFLPVHHFGMTCLAGSKVNIQHSETVVIIKEKKIMIMIIWFSWHVYLSWVILYQVFRESSSLYVYIYMLCVVVSLVFAHAHTYT